MKKRMLSLLCVLALCLGLLPTTALAAGEGAPDNLYVGNQNVKSGDDTTYWATTDSGELELVEGASDTSNNWNVKYDPNTATLTLNEAKISGSYDQYNNPFTAGIYAKGSSNQSVALTLELIGTNTITGNFGIYVDAQPGGTVGTNASLSITGDGSLTVTGTTSFGLYVISGTGNASLTIKNASVDAKTTQTYSGYAGVCVMSGAIATGTPNISLAVDGGNLTASGTGSSDGIQFYVGSSEATGATTSLTVSENAIVDAKTGGIRATGVDITPEFNIGSTGSTGGIVFDGTEGTVYGDVTLDESLTIDQDETLTIPQGSTLNTNGKLTNNGTLVIQTGGQLNGTPTGSGTVITAPTITTQPAGREVTVGQTAEFTVAATGENLSYQWQYSNNNGTNWNVITGATGSSYTTDAATLEMNNYQYQCVVSNSAGSVTSDPVTLTVKSVPVTGVKLDKTELPLVVGGDATLIATVEPANATNKSVTWESSNTDVATVVDGKVTAVKEGTATITVKTVDGNYTATCTVTVTDKTYTITADPAKLDFDAAYLGYKTQPAPQTVTITNTGNQQVTVTLPTATDFVITEGNGFANGSATIKPGNTATFTVQPKADLAVDSYKESINISGSNGNHKVSTSVDATFAVVDINDTSVDNKLTLTSGISAGISGTAFDTADTVKAELTRVLVQDTAYTASNTAFYDVKLQYSLDDGATWIEATEATFPIEGITVTLPYPSGTGKDTHNFRVVHMFTVTSTRLGTTAGNTEAPAVTKTDGGLQVTLKGLSPVVIGWDKIETPSSGASTTPAATATPAPSDNITYYTCPSCGYHNWTATDAGYRCDNCGYLESTKQLSGYGNVKGTYTPGSGATSTAASAVPQTGDESNPVLWTVLLLVSGLALGGLAIAKRKKQQ